MLAYGVNAASRTERTHDPAPGEGARGLIWLSRAYDRGEYRFISVGQIRD